VIKMKRKGGEKSSKKILASSGLVPISTKYQKKEGTGRSSGLPRKKNPKIYPEGKKGRTKLRKEGPRGAHRSSFKEKKKKKGKAGESRAPRAGEVEKQNREGRKK